MPSKKETSYTPTTLTENMRENVNDSERLGQVMVNKGMFVILAIWNIIDSLTWFTDSLAVIFVISVFLDAAINSIVIVYSDKLKGKRALWGYSIIISWNLFVLLSRSMGLTGYFVLALIMNVAVNILLLMFLDNLPYPKPKVKVRVDPAFRVHTPPRYDQTVISAAQGLKELPKPLTTADRQESNAFVQGTGAYTSLVEENQSTAEKPS